MYEAQHKAWSMCTICSVDTEDSNFQDMKGLAPKAFGDGKTFLYQIEFYRNNVNKNNTGVIYYKIYLEYLHFKREKVQSLQSLVCYVVLQD